MGFLCVRFLFVFGLSVLLYSLEIVPRLKFKRNRTLSLVYEVSQPKQKLDVRS